MINLDDLGIRIDESIDRARHAFEQGDAERCRRYLQNAEALAFAIVGWLQTLRIDMERNGIDTKVEWPDNTDHLASI